MPGTWSPAQIRQAYDLDGLGLTGAGQTIAIIDAYNDPNIAADLQTFDTQYGLPAPPSFRIVNQSGGSTLPPVDPAGVDAKNSESEISVDVEWAHSIAPGANILLVESNDGSAENRLAAVGYAATVPGVSVVSMSWGGPDYQGESSNNVVFTTPAGHAPVTFVASSGDHQYVQYPSGSPNVLSVGGTILQLSSSGAYDEVAWPNTGGGDDPNETEPGYQRGVQQSGQRSTPDVALNAEHFSIYDSYGEDDVYGWRSDGGTSFSAPSWAGIVALIDQQRAAQGLAALDGPSQTLPLIYHLPSSDFNVIQGGSNGSATAGPGYNTATGLGSPIGSALIADMARPFVVLPGSTDLYQVDKAGNLWQYSATTGWATIATEVRSAVSAGGTDSGLYVNTTGGNLTRFVPGQGFATIVGDGGVRSIASIGGGILYVNTTSGNLDTYVQGVGLATANASGTIRSIATDGDGGLYVLDTNDNLVWYDGGSLTAIVSNGTASAIAAPGDGGLYILYSNGAFGRLALGVSYDLYCGPGTVAEIAAPGDGGVYIDDTNGNLGRYVHDIASTSVVTNGSAESIAAPGDGGLYIDFSIGALGRYVSGVSYTLICTAGMVGSIADAGDGGLYIAFADGALGRYVAGLGLDILAWTGVTSILGGSSGTLAVTMADGSRWTYSLATGWVEVA